MKKSIVIAVIGMLLGVAIGTNVNRYFAHQHERTTAVMVLLQFHLQGWEQAIKQKNCPVAFIELSSLQSTAKEIPMVLPKADQQDAVFHHHVASMLEALSTPTVMQCTAGINDIKQVRDVCDECHRDYR